MIFGYLLFAIFLIACVPDECAGSDSCLFDKAIDLNDEFYCSKIANDQIKVSCRAEIAINSDDLDSCNFLESEYCITSIAEIRRDPLVCDNIANDAYHENCVQKMAILLNDSDICKNLRTNPNQDKCFKTMARVLKNIELCYFVTDAKNRDICIAGRAIKMRDSNLCYNVGNVVTKSVCYLRVAEETNKIKICDNIQIKSIRNDCRNLLQTK